MPKKKVKKVKKKVKKVLVKKTKNLKNKKAEIAPLKLTNKNKVSPFSKLLALNIK